MNMKMNQNKKQCNDKDSEDKKSIYFYMRTMFL